MNTFSKVTQFWAWSMCISVIGLKAQTTVFGGYSPRVQGKRPGRPQGVSRLRKLEVSSSTDMDTNSQVDRLSTTTLQFLWSTPVRLQNYPIIHHEKMWELAHTSTAHTVVPSRTHHPLNSILMRQHWKSHPVTAFKNFNPGMSDFLGVILKFSVLKFIQIHLNIMFLFPILSVLGKCWYCEPFF